MFRQKLGVIKPPPKYHPLAPPLLGDNIIASSGSEVIQHCENSALVSDVASKYLDGS